MTRILLMAASLRKDSLNKKLAKIAEKHLKDQKCEVDFAEFSDFDMPLYHGDVNAQIGLPEGAHRFIKRLKDSDGFILVSPEYNYSVPGTIKNLIDWVSRQSPYPWLRQMILLMSASPALPGGIRGLWHLRVPLEGCGAFVFPDMFSLSAAHTAFNDDGSLKNPELDKNIDKVIKNFLEVVERHKKMPLQGN